MWCPNGSCATCRGSGAATSTPSSRTADGKLRVRRRRSSDRGLLGLLEPGGVLLASVMSLLGAWRLYMPRIVRRISEGVAGIDDTRTVWETGDTRHQPGWVHVCRLFRAHEVTAMIAAAGAAITEISASGWGVHCPPEALEPLTADPRLWEQFLDLRNAAARRRCPRRRQPYQLHSHAGGMAAESLTM